jgi:hypothetical protein
LIEIGRRGKVAARAAPRVREASDHLLEALVRSPRPRDPQEVADVFLLDFTAEVRHFRFRSSVRKGPIRLRIVRCITPRPLPRGTFAMFVRFRPHG